MNGIYTSSVREACKMSYGKLSESYIRTDLFGLAPELTEKDKKYTKKFVDDVLCDKDNPLLLVKANPFHTIPNEVELKNALTCLMMIVYPEARNADARKNTEYSNEKIRENLRNFVANYLASHRDTEELNRQKIVRECTRTADPIEVLSECKNNCMFSEYKTTTGKRVFFPHDALNQLKLLRDAINDDLNFVNSLLKDDKTKVAQLHKFRGMDARKVNLKKLGDTSKVIEEKLKMIYGARGHEVKKDAAAVANRLKKQRKKRVRELFELVQNHTGGVNDALKEYFTMNKVLNIDTKSLKMNRRPGEGNYYRPAMKRQTGPELRLTKKAIDSITKRYKDDPNAFGAESLLEKNFPKLNRPLRLKGTGVTQGGNRKDYSRLSKFDVRERLVPKNDSSTITVSTSNKKSKGFEIDVCFVNSDKYCLYQDDIEELNGMTIGNLRSSNPDEILPFIASGDYIKQKTNNKTTYLRLKIDPAEQKMILGPMGQMLLDIPDVSTIQSNASSKPIDASKYPLRLADGSARTFKEMLKYLSTLIQNKFIEAVLMVDKLKKSGSQTNTVYIDKRIAMDKEIYLPHAITVVKRKGLPYIGLILRDAGNNKKQNQFMLQIPSQQQFVDIIGQQMTKEFEARHISPKEDGVYFILHKATRLGLDAQVLDASTASAKLRRYVRDMKLKDLSEDLKMWATKNQTDTRDVMLSPISPILDYVREKKGKSRLNYKYNRELKGAREKERRRRLPLPTVAGVQMPAARYNAGIQRAIPVNKRNPNLPVVPAIPVGYAM
jgi:hypothetical protein